MPDIKEKPSKYWAERQLADVAKNDAEALAAYKDMEKFYNALEKELSNEVAYFYQQYGTDNVLEFATLRAKASAADVKLMYEDWEAFAIKYPDYARLKPVREAMYKLDRYELLMEKARYQLSELGAKEAAIMRDSLKSTAVRTYGDMGKALSGNVALLDDLQADKMISTKWASGQNFSDRVWKNKDKLLGHLDYELRNGIIRGDDYKTLVGHLKSVTGASKRDAERLIRTESSYIANRANMQNYIDNGLKWYEYLAVEDLRTSEGCKSLDGQILPLEKAIIGSDYPPLHPNCRSRALPVSNRRAKEYGLLRTDLGTINDQHLKMMEKKIGKNILTDKVSITDERINHINSKPERAFEAYKGKIKDMIDDPICILNDNIEDTVIYVGDYKPGYHVATIIKLKTTETIFDNSVLTIYKTSEKRLDRMLRRYESIYFKK